MTTQALQIGKKVKYSNGTQSIYTGVIAKVKPNELVIIDDDDEAGAILWNAGFSVGSCIRPSQIIN